MGKIIVSENVTLDGVVQDPTGEEGFRHGGWFAQVGSNDRQGFYKAALDEVLRAEALLVGRRSYEFLAARWPSRTGELADRMNSIPKYVVSSTLEDPGWNNSTVVKGDAVNEVSNLRERLNGEIVVPASLQLVRTLIDEGSRRRAAADGLPVRARRRRAPVRRDQRQGAAAPGRQPDRG